MHHSFNSVTLAVISLVVSLPSPAAGLSERLKTATESQAITIEVAAGKPEKANYARVLPRLAARTAPQNVTLAPVESEGSVESTTGVCLGQVEAAITQRDATDLRIRKADCAGKVVMVGKALYPYYGYLVVANSNHAKDLSGLVSAAPEGKTVRLAVGKDGSGGAVTMGYMVRSNPNWERTVSTVDYGLETALSRITAGEIDGFFVMDAPDSDLIEQIKAKVDAKGKPQFKFLDVRPVRKFYETKDWNGRPMYQEATISSGWFSDVRTVSTDAVFIVSNAFYENRDKGGPRAVDVITNAIDAAQPDILVDTKTPRGWVSAAAQAQK